MPDVRISEIHYDNVGADAGEKIEISGPAGTVLTNYKIYLYNGNPTLRTVYATLTLSGTIPATCGTRGVVVVDAVGMQNGGSATAPEPDGLALVNDTQVIEFLSYEGVFTASGGPANGLTSTDIGVAEPGNDPIGLSLQRQPDGSWARINPSTFGACNDNGPATPPGEAVTFGVTPATASVAANKTVQLTATATDANGTDVSAASGITWKSDDTNIASVNSSGLVTGVAVGGPVTITAMTLNGLSAAAAVTITVPPVAETVALTPATPSIAKGGTQQFTATAKDASNNDVTSTTTFTWKSSVEAVATISASGLATGIGGGSTTITVTSQNGKIATAALTVTGPVTVPDVRFSEIHYDNGGTDANEAIEIEGPAGVSLDHWSIQLYNGDPKSTSTPLMRYDSTGVAGVLTALPGDCSARGVIVVRYPANGIQNGGSAAAQSPDGFALVDPNGHVVEFLSYEGSFTAVNGQAAGMTSTDIGVFEDGSNAVLDRYSLSRGADGTTWAGPAENTMGYVNRCGAPPPPAQSISFSGRSATADPALPIGFEAQIFATEKDNGNTVNTNITWLSETPDIASIDRDGVLRALRAGTATLRATATDGTTATIALPTIDATLSSATYVGNTELGVPTDGDASDDYIVSRPEYTTSFNYKRNTPNWVSFRLDPSNYAATPQDRCNCFTYDPELKGSSFTHITTADYTGAGAAAGYGIDRGHLARSADRAAGNLDNATTYLFSNIIPQAADVNQGPWAKLENYLGDIAQAGSEVYVIAGASGTKGTVKNEGKITIPAQDWKVAVVMPHNLGLADIHSPNDVQVIAVIMPNDPNPNPDWTTYKTTVDAIQKLSGYDLLDKLPDDIECVVEKSNCAPTAAIGGDKTGAEGSTLTFNANGSSDPDAGDVLTYTWTFGDGGTATGLNVSHTFNVDQGDYPVTVTVSDGHGHSTPATMTVSIANANPTASLASIAPVVEGSNFTLTLLNATDPSPADASSLRYAFDCGDGQGYQQSASATFACATNDNGTRAVQAKVIDKDGGFSNYSGTVAVENAPPVITSFTTPAVPTSTGAQVSATVTFTDVGSADTHTAVIAWGDGQTSTVQGSAGQATATHSYATTDFYTITVTVTDDDGGSATRASSVLVVYDASAGSVTGGGYVRGADGGKGSDKTHFNLDARYAGGSTPSVRFDLRTSEGMVVNGGAFDYLVVKGATATVRGTGTLADGTAVGILVSVRDGKLAGDKIDRVRIKVWSGDNVLFDTQAGVAELAPPGTLVDGGNVTVHR